MIVVLVVGVVSLMSQCTISLMYKDDVPKYPYLYLMEKSHPNAFCTRGGVLRFAAATVLFQQHNAGEILPSTTTRFIHSCALSFTKNPVLIKHSNSNGGSETR
jgi:hypothetical protein